MRSKPSSMPLLVPILLLAGCAGRDAVPTATVQPHDTASSCTMVTAELAANRQRISALSSESTGTTVGNVALAVVGIAIFPPLLFAMDLKDAASTERDSLAQRNNFLSALAAERCGSGAPAPADVALRQSPSAPVAAAPSSNTPTTPAQPAPAATAAVSALQPNVPIRQTLEQHVMAARAECQRQRRRNCDAVAEAAASDYENAWQTQGASRARAR